jgi:hypothetical protein
MNNKRKMKKKRKRRPRWANKTFSDRYKYIKEKEYNHSGITVETILV